MYPPSPSMRAPQQLPPPRSESPERGRDHGGPVHYNRPPPYSYQPSWVHGGGAPPYGHPAMGPPQQSHQPPHTYHPHSHSTGPPPPPLPPGQESVSKQSQPGPSPYSQPQHFSIGPAGPYPTHPSATHGPPAPPYGGPPNHMYGYGGQHRPGPWGYGPTPPGFEHQQRYGFPPHQHMPMSGHNAPPPSTPSSANALKSTSVQRSQPSLTRSDVGDSSTIHSSDSQGDRGFSQRKSTNQPGKIEEEEKSPSIQGRQSTGSQKTQSEDVDLNRGKTSSVTELTLAEVKPIQSDFHFFVHDTRAKFQSAAEQEVNRILQNQKLSIDKKSHKYKYLINSNLNCRLLRAWENLSLNERTEYMKLEEDDRRRFMDEDEVASRHCFTLTARVRSPSKNKNSSSRSGEHDEDGEQSDGEESVDKDGDEEREVVFDRMKPKSGTKEGHMLQSNDGDIVPTVSPTVNRGSVSKGEETDSAPSFKADNIVTPPNKREDSEKQEAEDASLSATNDSTESDEFTPTKTAKSETNDIEKKVIKRPQNGIASNRDESPPKRNRFAEDSV